MKRGLKRVASVFISIVLLLCFVSLSVYAVDTKINTETIKTVQGSVIEIPIRISGNNGIMGFGFTVTYDKSVFEPISVAKGALCSQGVFDDSISVSKSNSFKIIWTHSENVVGDGELFTLKFKVKENASDGNYKISLTCSQDDTFNEKWQDVKIDCDNINVTVGNPHNEPVKPDFAFWSKIKVFILKVWNIILGWFK